MRFRDRVAVVTGAGRGIGRAVARRLASEGASVVVNDLAAGGADETARLVSDAGGRALPVAADISAEADVSRLMAEAAKHFGGVDVLVNNAGIDLVAPVEKTTLEDWQRMQSVDLTGAFLCARHALPLLKRSNSGAVVNVASIHAFCTQPGRAAYAAAKAGLLGFTRALALDLGPLGIRVNAVVPGYIRTEIWNLWLSETPDPEATIAGIAGQHPLRRVGTPEDIAAAVAFLSSDDAAFVSGASLVVDGGLTAMFPPPPA
jgi:NAD(P)-dependent dehydrogenase (short-subunit alcohol dehydrogenase family)